MKQTISNARLRVNVAQAKSQLSRLLRLVDHTEITIHNRGHDVARLVSQKSGQKNNQDEQYPFVTFLNRLELIRKRAGIKGTKLNIPKATIRPHNPFENERE
jgi:antitoxin (DNA-binding transcriptional repressor) of toxin-antitoxin stability system